MANAADYKVELVTQLDALFAQYTKGEDVSPGRQHRLEGFMQAGVFAEWVSLEDLQALVAESHLRILGCEMDEPFPPGCDRFVPIPAAMKRAPVYRTTKD